MHFLTCLIFCALLGSARGAPVFIAPDESYPLIRRDLLPLDIAGIASLADQLALLADDPGTNSGADLRRRAQLIVLSQRLSPAQARARAILRSLTAGESRPPVDKELVKEALSRVLKTAEWLLALPQDDEGQRLGQLILDILASQVKGHPLLPNHQTDGAGARWQGLIAPLEKFENKIEEAVALEKVDTQYLEKALLIRTPLITRSLGKDSRPLDTLQAISLVISDSSDKSEKITFRPRPNYDPSSTVSAVGPYFKSIGKPLPKGFDLTIDTGDSPYASENKSNLAAPVAILLDAAISGRPLKRNTYLFARLEDDGELSRPAKAWPILLKLADSLPPEGSTLIVPPEISDDLEALLVLDKAGFLLNYEVVSAKNLEEARPLFYEDGVLSPELTTSVATFHEVSEKSKKTRSFQSFVSHQSVKKRLNTAVQSSPRHLSAACLAILAVKRPQYFSEKMLARELLRCLDPLAAFSYNPGSTSDKDFRDMYKLVRKELDPLDWRISPKERPLYKETLELTNRFKNLTRKNSDRFSGLVSFNIFKAEMTAFRRRLVITSGDSVPLKKETQ